MVDWQVGQRVVVTLDEPRGGDPGWSVTLPGKFAGEITGLNCWGRDLIKVKIDKDYTEFTRGISEWYCAPRWLSIQGGPW